MNNILFCWRRTTLLFLNYKQVFIFFCIIYSLLFTNNAEAFDNRLEKISFSAMVGNRVQVQLSFARPAVSPLKFSTDNPARIVLDFPETKIGLKNKSQSIGIGVVQGMRAVEARDRTRVVLNLIRMVPFNIKVVGNKVLVSIENRTSKPTSVRRVTSSRSSTSPTSGSLTIQDIDFQRTENGAGRIAITLSAPSIIVDMRQESADIVLEFPETNLPSRLDRRLNVLDFGTPISFIDTFPEGDKVRINITVKGNYEHHAFQTGNIYFIEIKDKPKVKPESLRIEERKYEGQLVSFNFQDIDVRAVLKLLFDLPGVNMNIIAGAEVKGSVSLRLKNVPWDQALDILLEARDLGMRKIGNVVMIDLKKNLEERKQREFEAQKKLTEIEPLHTEFIVINYAKSADLASLLQAQSGGSKHSFLSERGTVSTDERTNTLIIQETASKITEIRKLIASLDTPIRQVLIESRIVIATNNFTKALGVKFGYSANKPVGSGYNAWLGGKQTGDTTFSSPTSFNEGGVENYIVSLPAAGATGSLGLAIGKIGSYLLQLELSAMQNEGSGEIVSSPRLITGNQQEASIMQGQQIAFLSSGGVGTAGTVEWKDATVELKVTPQITPDDRISLELAVKKDAPGAIFNGQTSIDKRELQTNVLVNNGETVVLGGVYERTRSKNTSRVPFFADLPLIGVLFRNKSNQDDKSELLIFVTPKIIKETS